MVNYQFLIGEMAIAIGRPDRPQAECQVVGYFKHPNPFVKEPWYVIHVPGFDSGRTDKNWLIRENCLLKKPPPQCQKREMDQIVSWKDCGWQPQKQVENRHG